MIICETATYLSHPVSHRPQAAISRCADAPGLAMQLPRVLKMSKIPILRFTELPLLRQTKSFGPSAPIAYVTSVSPPDEAVAWPGAAFLQITARANPCSRHLWGTLARAVASI